MNLTSSRRQLTILIALMALTAGLTFLGSRPAAAHDALSSATPAAGDTVTTAISSVTLTFSETPLAEFANAIALNVASPSGASATTGTPTAQERTLTAPVTMTETGLHTVTWQSVSSDGHTVSGSYTFSYAGPIGDEPAATATATTPPAAAPAAETVASPSSSPEAEPAPSTTIPIIAGVTAAAVLLLGALLAFRVLRARERDQDARAPDTEDDPEPGSPPRNP